MLLVAKGAPDLPHFPGDCCGDKVDCGGDEKTIKI